MTTFEQYMTKIQDLTEQNLAILKLINESLYSKSDKVAATVNGSTYTIPSFMYIENKLAEMGANWNRLVNAPLSGDAAFVFDGNSRRIMLQGFENAPSPVKIDSPKNYNIESNDIFKDFVSPLIYVKYDLKDIPSNISKVNVRKYAIGNSAIYDEFAAKENPTYADLSAILERWEEDVDYVMYDTVYDMPIRKPSVSGLFKVTGNVSCTFNGEYIENGATVTASPEWTFDLADINYMYDSGSMTKELVVGDYLHADDDSCKYRITSITHNTNGHTITARVISGYKKIDTNTTLKYFKNEDFSADKYVKVPLEEDRYIIIFIAPINSNLNVQAEWSNPSFFDTNDLKDASGSVSFHETYMSQIKNIGDILYDLTKFSSNTLSNINDETLASLTEYAPEIEDDEYSVVVLNDHLLDNAAIENIYKLNNQKAEINNQLIVIQNNIDELTSALAAVDLSLQNASIRADLQTRLDNYKTQKISYTNDLINTINQITIATNNTVIPSAGTKYVIKGAIDIKTIEDHFAQYNAEVIKIDILYRYKNINKDASNAVTINDMVTVSDWNRYLIDYRQKVAYTNNIGKIEYKYESYEVGEDGTTPKWRSFAIPITQGETVDMRYRVQYNFGYPYVSVYSDWSDTINVEFPDSLIQHSDIDDIITSNNNDTRATLIKRELISEGVSSHIDDKIIDQDLTYLHKPESISSGFYTEDSRRIISLKDKLYDLNNELKALKAGAFGNNYKDLNVTISDAYQTLTLNPNEINATFGIPGYEELPEWTKFMRTVGSKVMSFSQFGSRDSEGSTRSRSLELMKLQVWDLKDDGVTGEGSGGGYYNSAESADDFIERWTKNIPGPGRDAEAKTGNCEDWNRFIRIHATPYSVGSTSGDKYTGSSLIIKLPVVNLEENEHLSDVTFVMYARLSNDISHAEFSFNGTDKGGIPSYRLARKSIDERGSAWKYITYTIPYDLLNTYINGPYIRLDINRVIDAPNPADNTKYYCDIKGCWFETNWYKIETNVEGAEDESQLDDIDIKEYTVFATITNTNETYPMNLYSMYPGDPRLNLYEYSSGSRWCNIADHYVDNNNRYNIIKVQNPIDNEISIQQKLNQVVYFRIKSKYTNDRYEYNSNTSMSAFTGSTSKMEVFPYISDLSNIQPRTAVPGDYVELKPGEAITIPINTVLSYSGNESSIKATVSFDIWNSPFKDPITYTFTLVSNKEGSSISKIVSAAENAQYSPVIQKPSQSVNK